MPVLSNSSNLKSFIWLFRLQMGEGKSSSLFRCFKSKAKVLLMLFLKVLTKAE